MKKLYRKGTVHPSPSSAPPPPQPPQQPPLSADHFSLTYLPAAILTLAATLSSDDKEVLSYLLSCSSSTSSAAAPFDFDHRKKPSSHHHNHHHPPAATCYCFSCYTTYWARWDSSPNRQRIHEIIDAFEDGLLVRRKKKQGISRREKRKKNNRDFNSNLNLNAADSADNGNNNGSIRVNPELGLAESVEEGGGQLSNGEDETGEKQGSVRKLVSFIGERIWGSVWG